MSEEFFRVVATAIIRHPKTGKFLITKRSGNKKRWPNKWTVPGGNLSKEDYINKPNTTKGLWYNTMENVVVREVREETNLYVQNIQFLCDITTEDSVILSYVAELDEEMGPDYDIPKLQLEETDDYAWVSVDEARQYDLIDGILSELIIAEGRFKQ